MINPHAHRRAYSLPPKGAEAQPFQGLVTTSGRGLAEGFPLWRLAAKACAGRLRHTGEAVAAMRRLPCDAQARGRRPNSLRALRALRSNKGRQSDHEARYARGHAPCASRRLAGAPQPARTRLGNSMVGAPTVKDAPSASQPTSSLCRGWRSPARATCGTAAAGGPGPGARQRASSSDSQSLSERSARRARSEFGCAGPGPHGAAQSAHRADRHARSPRRGPPAAARGATPTNRPMAYTAPDTGRDLQRAEASLGAARREA